MIIIAIIIGCLLGAIIGLSAPTISYIYSGYLAIAIIAALDSVFGGITSVLKGNFDFRVFIDYIVEGYSALEHSVKNRRGHCAVARSKIFRFQHRIQNNV